MNEESLETELRLFELQQRTAACSRLDAKAGRQRHRAYIRELDRGIAQLQRNLVLLEARMDKVLPPMDRSAPSLMKQAAAMRGEYRG